jgi:hypothetical protein
MLKQFFLLFTPLIFILFSCSSFDKVREQTEYVNLFGPLSSEWSVREMQQDLSRWIRVEGVGEIYVQLLSPALLQAINLKQEDLQKLSRQERIETVNHQIDFLVRYETCFTMTVRSAFPEAIDYKFWKVHLAYNDNFILPITVRDTTKEIINRYQELKQFEGEYQGFATLCTVDKIDLLEPFTVVLKPNYRLDLPTIRLTWERPQSPLSGVIR